ncbi:MAG: dTDP-4-dehydrorhamnose reductase [Chloroflexi bacterium]|nr:MAG: dTDP-4-dehydrorhamnose reductase [Chloroflexota bacterium]
MKILLLGNTGQLGSELAELLPQLGDLTALDYPQIDMSDEAGIRAVVEKVAPQLIVNATAYTAVDQAEKESALATAINAHGIGFLAEEAKKHEAFLIHYSTDYVFDGKKGQPYLENDAVNPLSVYGRSKWQGEEEIRQRGGDYLIFRTSWVYSLRNQSGFVQKALQWSRQYETLQIVDDQISNPTWAKMLAKVSVQVLEKGIDYLKSRKGLYHLSGAGFSSRYAWAKEILALDPRKEEQKTRKILPAKSADFPTPAQRPTFSALNLDLFQKTFKIEIPDWKKSLREALGA